MQQMKQLILLLGLGLGFFSANAQNEKNLVFDANAEARMVSGFTAVEVSGAIDLFLSQGNEEAAAVSASSSEAIGRIRTEVKNGTLHIYFDGKGWNWKTWGNNKMKAYVTFKNLTRVEASGACNVKSTEAIKVPELKIQLSGASDYTGELQVGLLKLDASGASNIRVSGKAEKLEIDASGACNIKAYDLKADYGKLDASGASNIGVTINKELNAEASGGSNIYYKGEGMIRNISSSGGASVKRKADN
jgi:hypothetical protein